MRNTVLITDTIRESKDKVSKKEIQQRTGVAWGTMCKVVDGLIDRGYLFTSKHEPVGRGRPMIPIGINAESAYFVGLDIGASLTRAIVCNLNFDIVYKGEIQTPKYSNTESFFKWIFGLYDGLAKAADISAEKIKSIGVSVSGNVDSDLGVVVSGGNWGAKWGVNIPLGGRLAEHSGLPVSVVSSPAAGVLGEFYFGKWKGYSNIVTIGLAVGISSGVISNGRLLISHPRRPIGYIGHMLIPGNEHICTCGFKGCLESYSGGEYLAAVAREVLPRRPDLHSAPALDKAAKEGFEPAVKIVSTAASYNAVGIASMIQLYSPDVLIFTGGQSKHDGFLYNETLKELKKILPPERLNRFEIGLSDLGSLPSVLGAMRFAYERYF